MRTIFITSFHPLIYRNILSTGLIEQLAVNDCRVVVIGHAKKKAFFEREFSGTGAVFEGVEMGLAWQDKFLRYIALSAVNTNSLRIKRMTEMSGSGRMLAMLIGNNSIGYTISRFLNKIILPTNSFSKLFDKYCPDLIFLTDIQNEFDVRLAVEAYSRRIKTLGMIRSWDNLSCKGTLRHLPDKLAVNNNIIKNEATSRHGVPEETVEVVGIPHYDNYISGKRISRESFCAQLGLDPNKKIILFAPAGNRYLKNNTIDRDILDILGKKISGDWQILVRLPPADNVSYLDDMKSGGQIIIDRPMLEFATPKNNEIGKEADRHLADSLYWSDIVISGPSTMCVDAAFFNKPAILVAFDGYEKRPYKEGILRYYDYDHWRPVLASNGAALCRSREEFASELSRAVSDKNYKNRERRELVLGQCQFTEGGSTDRLLNVILKMI